MSYILDALKKSERQRPPGPVPDLFTVQGPQQPSPPRPRWLGFAAGAAIAATLIAGWAWLGRDGGEDAGGPPSASVAPEAPPLSAKNLTSSAPASPATPTVPAAAPAPAASHAGPVRASRGRRRPAGPASPVSPKPLATPSAAEEPSPVAQAAPPPSVAPAAPAPAAAAPAAPAPPAEITPPASIVPAAAQSQPPAGGAPIAAPAQPPPAAESRRETAPPDAPAPQEASPPADGRVLEPAELPASVRAELPKLAISGHVWSEEPSLRMLTVDDRILREGAEAAPGARVQEITPEGAVFVFKGWRYRVGGFRR